MSGSRPAGLETTHKVERLVNLTVALLEARRPLTFEELRRRTGFYAQSDAETARRMFERDKDDLRRLGVPVDTRAVDAFEVEVGYIVDRAAYELPDVALTPDEVAALALALQMTEDDGARLGLAKLAALAPDPADVDAAPDAYVALDAAAVDSVAEAVVRRQPLRFGYRTGTGADSRRVVDPYAVVQRRGAWYLVGRDHDRDALRAFRLDRVIGALRPAGAPGAFEAPDDLDVAAAVSGPAGELVDLEVAVAPAAAWAVAVRGGTPTGQVDRDGRGLHRLPGASSWRTLPWLLGLGADVEVRSPDDVRAQLVARLRAVVEVHGGPPV